MKASSREGCAVARPCCKFRRRGYSLAQALLHSFSCSAQHLGNLPGNPQGPGSRRLAWFILALRGSLWGSAPHGDSLLLHPYHGGPGSLFLLSSLSKAPKPMPIA